MITWYVFRMTLLQLQILAGQINLVTVVVFCFLFMKKNFYDILGKYPDYAFGIHLI